MSEAFRCSECHMTFGTIGLLQKHKRKFCVGGSIGDPDSLLLRKGLYSADSPRPRPLSPDSRPVEIGANRKVVQQLKALKERREKIRDIRNFQERLLLDNLEDIDRKPGSPHRTRSRLPLSRHPEVRQLQFEYERLREQEVVPGYGGPLPPRVQFDRQDNISPMSDTSMSIHLEGEQNVYKRPREDYGGKGLGVKAKTDYPHYNPNQDAQLRQLAETHGRTMEYLQTKNKDLEKQREDIRRRLEQLGQKGPAQDNTADLLAELRAQEERNQRSLNELRRQLYEMGQKRVNVIKFDMLEENLERSRKLLENFQEKLFNDPEFDCLISLHPKCDASIQLNEQSLMNLASSSKLSTLAKSCDNVTKSLHHVTKSCEQTMPSTSGISMKSCNSHLLNNEDLKKKVEEFKNKLTFFHNTNREVEKPMNYPQPIIQQAPPPPLPPPEKEKRSYIYPVYYGSSLVAEITAMRQAYLQNGGNDPDVLSQLSQMQAEAQKIEDEMKNANYDNRHRDKKPDLSGKMQMIELENERLHKELLLLQEQNFLNQNKRKSDREDELERELQRLREEQLRKMMELQNEIALLKQRATLERRPDPPPPAPPQPKNAEMPWLLQRPYVDVEPMQPYDQYAGFMIFYDFVLNLDPRITACRLIVGLHSTGQSIGEPTVLPTVYTEPSSRGGTSMGSNAVIGARQPVPKCPPDSDLGVVVELQLSGGPASEYDRHSLITRAWVKLPLFDNDAKLIAGKFRIPFRNVPIKPFLHASELQNLEKYDDAELYYRIVNMRDAEVQSLLNISASNYNQYDNAKIPSLYKTPTPVQNPPPPLSTGSRQSSREPRLPSITPTGAPLLPRDTTIGFQVDRVRKAEYGEGKVRLTAYYASTGKVVQSSTSPVTCSTTAVKSNFKFGYHVFGQQEATFSNVDMQGDMVVIARFYLRKRQDANYDDSVILHDHQHEATLYEEETLVAWSAIPLVMSTEDMSLRTRRNYNPNTMSINTGTHTLKLFYPPVPDASQIPFDNRPYKSDWTRYGKASLRVHIFQGQPRPGSLTPSEESDDPEEVLPEYAWLPLERKTPPREPFLIGDGFDVYIDGCRFLPDSVTFSKVAGRILDRKYGVFGKDINTSVKLDSDIYNPVYENKIEYRENNIPPSATLLLKIYTLDNFYKSLSVVGYATLNIFVESGTERQPTLDQPGLQVSLNEGAHQLRLYSQGPNGVDPLTESCLRDSNIRIVPCASALVRLTRVPKGSSGKALEQSKVPQADWLRLGLHVPRPRYSDRIYYSSKCLPTKGESRLFHSMMKRTPISMREAVSKLAKAKESFYRSDKNVEEFIRNKLTKGQDNKAIDQDLTYICQYSPKQGIKIAVDSALNLPWTNFTHAHVCLNPPGAFYMGTPHAAYDKLTFTELLDLRSTNTSPTWKDGFKHFPRRAFHRFLCAIIHLQEVQVTIARDNYKYGLLEQAWTAVQLFVDKYAYTTTFQLPLFQGAPTPQMLKQLAREPCRDWMERNIRNNTIYLLEGASVFVRVADGRRDDELAGNVAISKLVEVNTDYIPAQLEADYTRERPGKVLETLVPQGKSPDQFNDGLAVKFKNLVYKLYEDDKVSK